MRSSTCAVALIAAVGVEYVVAQLAQANNETMPTANYITRPQSYAPVLNVSLQGEFSPGYIFMAPYQAPGAGPYIYDKFGNLVWDGFGVVGSATVHNFHQCTYQGETHLCAFQGNQQEGYAVGQAIVINSDYRIVATVNTGNNLQPADQHEFQLINDGETALLTSYQTIPFDLSNLGIQGQGYLSEGVFQEVNVSSGVVLFEWYSSNHVDISDTQIKPASTDISGDGLTPHTAFDYFHINSIDKSMARGNYLISARHVSTLYYINGTDQSTIWQLSCSNPSDFQCTNFNFTFQHDARLMVENDTTTVFSLFDNASNGYAQSTKQSSGMIITIDHNAGEATMLSRTFAPFGQGVLSNSQGNTQVLPNGNIFHGWGSVAAISEHRPRSTDNTYEPVLAAQFCPLDGTFAMNYRAFSFDGWQSTPSNTKPSVYSYAQNTDSANRITVSWNGCTTVQRWRFYGASEMGQEFKLLGATTKQGFETVWTTPQFYPWVMVEALGPDGTSLRNSSYQPTFVPSQALANSCNADGCASAAASASS